jgi:hypothetical protein
MLIKSDVRGHKRVDGSTREPIKRARVVMTTDAKTVISWICEKRSPGSLY